MRKQLLTLFLAFGVGMTFAQTAREEIHENIRRTASNYLAYIEPTATLTKAPAGYEPFYLSHYGRHGSRWLIDETDYTSVIGILKDADKAGALTDLGRDVLAKLERFYPTSINRLGELTTVGERQHHGIGKRLTQHFPEVFSGNAQVDARSTVVIRCILSMEAECEELAAFNPKITFHNDVSESFQYYLNQPWDKNLSTTAKKGRKTSQYYRTKFTHPERLSKTLFSDPSYVETYVDMNSFMYRLFDVVSNMQSHDTDIDLYNLYTEEECYDQWKIRNIDWYLSFGPAPLTDGIMPYTQRNLLRNVIETADTIVNKSGYNGATMRFGHEVCVMPLACLMELDSCGRQVSDLEHLDQQWVNYRIYPMASNIQLVFYRPKKGKGDILVKALLNEKETTLPIPTDCAPYYKWKDLRAYYLKKLEAYKEQ